MAQARDPHARLTDLERQLDDAFRRLEGKGDLDPERREGEALRQRRARLHTEMEGGPAASTMEREIESLADEVKRWAAGVDQRFQRQQSTH